MTKILHEIKIALNISNNLFIILSMSLLPATIGNHLI